MSATGASTVARGARDLGRDARVEEAATAIGARASGDGSATWARVCTDSRTLEAGDLFFCLRGPSFDAHDFAADVAAGGAAAIVCEEARRQVVREAVAGRCAVLAVADPLRALGDLAAWHRRGFAGPVVAITGSNGKTTTKEMLRAVLAEAHGSEAVLATRGNLNNLIGAPLTVLGIGTAHAAAVIEMGMNAPGEIARLVEIAAPTVGLVTCVAEAHLEGLGTIEGVARAKGELYEGLPPSAVAIVNAEDEHVVRESGRFAGRHLAFGRGGEVRAERVACARIDAATFDLVADGRRATVELPLGGPHNVHNALGAAAAALATGVDLATIAAGLSRMQAPPMRMSVERLPGGIVLVNDAYNANPGSLAASLATLGAADARPLVVLGDMLELGPRAAELHRRVGAEVAAIDPALVCVRGELAGEIAAGARDAGLDARRIRVCAGHDEAAAEVARVWQSGDAVLVKGSRGAAMEKVADALRRLAGQQRAGSKP